MCAVHVQAAPPTRPTPKRSTHTQDHESVKQALARKQYKKALSLLRKQKVRAPHAEVLYLRARTLRLQKKYKAAAKVALSLVRTYPKSRFYTKTWMMAASAYVEARTYKPAQAIFGKHLKTLLSDKRKLKIANIYLKYADQYFKKMSKTKAYHTPCRKAISFYKRALDLGLPKAQKRKVYLRLGLSHFKLGQIWQARRIFKKASKTFKKGPHADEFMYHLARCHMRDKNRSAARRTLQDLRKDHPKSSLLPETYVLLAKTYGLPNRISKNDLALGIETLRTLLKRYPTHPKSLQAAFDIAYSYFRNNRYDDAIKAFTDFIKRDAKRAANHKARLLAKSRYHIGLCYYRQQAYQQAIKAFQAFLTAHPTDQLWPRAQRQIVNARYQKAQTLFSRKQWKQAHAQYTAFLKRYPLDSRSAQIMSRLADIAFHQKQYKQAIEAWKQLVSKYPRSYQGRMARLSIAQTYEFQLKQYKQALTYYKKVRYWTYRTRAQKAIRRIKGKGLSLLTPRIYHTGEKAILKASVRNIKKLNIRLYRIDAETYFRKMNRFAGMEKLDIQLIRPDKEWEVNVPSYKPYHLHELPIKLDSTKPTVAVVQVTGDKLFATTVAIVSDLRIITKANRNALFVFAMHGKTPRPLANTKVLVSDGSKMLLEGKTNKQGVLNVTSKKLKQPSQLQVLALHKGSIASVGNSLSGISYCVSRQPVGLLYTEKPAYKPGETVHIRGILREVKDGNFQLPTRPYTFELLDAHGQVVLKQTHKLSGLGTFHTTFTPPASAPTGRYRMKVSTKKGPTFWGDFQLAKYTLPKYLLSLNMKHRVYMRHQTIKGTFQLRYIFGTPAAKKRITYQLGALKKTGVTNNKGELSFSFPTRELALDKLYTLYARIPQEGVSMRSKIWLRSTAFDLGLSSVRKVYAAGESFEIKLKAADPQGTPAAAKVKLQWLRHVNASGRKVERKVGETNLTLDKKGHGAYTLRLKKGGHYTLRAKSKDRWGQPVVAQYKVFVSGEDDKQVLRLLSDKDHVQVGDSIKVKLLSRRSGPALITYEADQVLKHKLLPSLPKGESLLPIKFEANMSPNFSFSVALLHKQSLFTTKKEFFVARHLKISITPKKKKWLPGEQVELLVETKDQGGKPVSAEVSLAVVDRTLLSIYPDKTSSLRKLFYAFRRRLQYTTQSSHTYKHKAQTGTLSKALQEYMTRKAGLLGRLSGGMGNMGPGSNLYQQNQTQQRRGYSLRANRQRRYGRYVPRSRNGVTENGDGDHEAPKAAVNAPTTGKQQFLKQLRKIFSSTAYWNPSIVTNKKGQATITWKMPQTASTWSIHARGVAHPTLVGDGKSSIITQKPLLAVLHLPTFLTRGDHIQPHATLHNQTNETLTLSGTVRFSEDKKVYTLKGHLPAHQSKTFTFPTLKTKGYKKHVLKVQLRAIGKGKSSVWQDGIEQDIRIRARGVNVQAAHAGISGEHQSWSLKLPGKGPFTNKTLTLRVGPLSSRWLSDLAASLSDDTFAYPGLLYHRAQITLAALDQLKSAGQHKTMRAQRLVSQLHHLVRSLWLLKSKGRSWYRHRELGWDFIGKFNKYKMEQPLFTARVYKLIVAAKTRWGAFAQQKRLKKLRSAIKKYFHSIDNDGKKALLLTALLQQASDEKDELFTYANRLFRKRTNLDLESLCQLGEALLSLGRTTLAKQLVRYIEEHVQQHQHQLSQQRTGRRSLTPTQLAQVAFGLELLAKLSPRSSVLQKGIPFLLTQRRGRRWPSLQETSRAARALTAYYKHTKMAKVRLSLHIKLNGKTIKKLALYGASPQQVITLRGPQLAKGAAIEIIPSGVGQFRFSSLLTGSTSSPSKTLTHRFHSLKRSYTPAYQRIKNTTITPGFSVIRNRMTPWTNKVKSLRVGEHARVSLYVKLKKKHGANDDIKVIEPLPGGARVLPSSITVSYGRYRLEPGRIVFLLNRSRRSWNIKYALYGTTPGHYSIPATTAWSFSHPQRFSIGTSKELTILPADAKKKDHYTPTPDELFKRGKVYYGMDRYAKAHTYFSALLKQYKLRQYYLKQVARMMLHIALKHGKSDEIVRFFELHKEQSPNDIIEFAQIMKVGQAYAETKEYERASMVYKATLAARFLKELQVASTLESEGQFAAASTFIQRLLSDYPDLKSVQEAHYALAQSVFQYADKHKQAPTKRQKWLGIAASLLKRFVWMYPENPVVDAATYTHANVMLAQNKRKASTLYLRELAKRYPKSSYLDNFHYLEAYALYLERKDKRALTLLKKVSSEPYPDGKGGTKRSKDRYLASYLIAQIHHARHRLGDALKWYKRIKTRFPDAKVQTQYFEKRLLKLPEVTTLTPTQKSALKVTHQNVKSLTILSYYVDLMKLYLLKKNLNAVTRINLAGITPSYRGKRRISQKHDFSAKTSSLKLPLKRRGSYLVVLKSKHHEVSGILLRTALKLDVQQDASTGRVTVHLYERGSRLPVPGATIRIVGSKDKKFHKGKTDLRGIFTTENIIGKATVIAQKGDDFAFFRGKRYLQSSRRHRRRRRWKRPRRNKSKYNFDMLDNIRSGNSQLQEQGRRSLRRLYKKSRRGVQAKSAF